MGAEPWSSPASWQGALPKTGEVVTIASGNDILLDFDPPALGGLIVQGKLTFALRDLHLASRWILIDGGSLNIGSANALHTNETLITLIGAEKSENITEGGIRTDPTRPGGRRSPRAAQTGAGMPAMNSNMASGMSALGTKFITVMNGGRLEIHGARAQTRNWTQLQGNASAGATQLRVAETIRWQAGDQLVIAPSGFEPAQSEAVTVTSVVDSVIHFDPPLRHDHWGELQVIEGHRVDERAEVACLSRNIVIQGDAASEALEFGGHLMFCPHTTVHLEGVEFYRMGQKGLAGRYPIHWHLTGDHEGDYARGNSIHHSYHRAIVTHGTSNVLVENNVSYDVWSHAVVPSENGLESGNRFIGNLAVLTRRLDQRDFAFRGRSPGGGGSSQSEGRPGAFWMKSPDAVLVGNHVAGVVDGMGFYYDGPGPNERWTGAFSNNTAHGCSGPSGTVGDQYGPFTRGYGLFMAYYSQPAQMRFKDYTAYKNSLSGLWLEGPDQRVQNAALADNGTGAILFQTALEDSVIVG